MSTATTQPIWKDPFARFMGCIAATVASWMLLVGFVTVPYMLVPTAEFWLQVIAPFVERLVGSPENIVTILAEGPAAVGIVAFAAWSSMALFVLSVPVFVTVGAPLAASYIFWMKLVCERVLEE